MNLRNRVLVICVFGILAVFALAFAASVVPT